MAGLKINICFWYLDENLVDEIVRYLRDGNYDPHYMNCKEPAVLEKELESGDPDLVIADYDLPDILRNYLESLHSRQAFHIPLIYMVGEKNEQKAAETLKRGVWDYLLKSHLVKLVPTVYSSQKYGKVLKQSKKVQGELEASEAKYRSIYNTVQDGMLLIDPDAFTILDFNRSIRVMFGLPEEWDRGQVIDTITRGDGSYCADWIREVAEGLRNQASVTFLCNNLRMDGKAFWTENTLSRFTLGPAAQYILVIRDIQEQKEMEESLQKSREHFRNLAENSPDIIMRFNAEHRHTYVNKRVEDLVGIPVKQFINRSHAEMGIFPADMVNFWEEAIDKVFSTGKNQTHEFDFDKGDSLVSFEWRLFPEFDDRNGIRSVLAIARDITEAKKASKAINKSEERLKLAVEATSLGYWDWTLLEDKVFYSPIYFRMLGYAPDELPLELQTWHRLLHDEDREKSICHVEQAIKSGEDAFEIEFRLLCKDGSYKWISGRGQVVERDEHGAALRLIGTHEDISERKRNEDIQRTLFNISNAVNTTVNLDQLYEKIREYLGRIVDTTNCFLALYDEETNMLTMPFHRDEIDSYSEFPAGKTLTGYVLSTRKAQLIDAEREKQLTEQGLIEPVGAPCVSWLGVPLKTDNRIIGVFVVQSYNEDVVYTSEDVRILEFVSGQIALAVERKRDQDNVRESQEKQRRIFESSPDPIIVVDRNGIIIDYNTSLLVTLHITNEPVIGQNIFHFIGKNHWRTALRKFRQTWKEGYLKNLEFEIHRADGTSFESEVSTGAIYNNNGEPESVVVLFKDISERKETERNLREAKEKAEESDRLKTAFLSNMSHEIRTPMNAIVGFSDLLNDDSLGQEERSEFIAQINLGAANLMHLIDDIIDISKIEAGQIKVNKEDCDINELLKEEMVMFRQDLDRLNKSHLELRLNWKWPDRKLTLRTDPFRVKQIFSNLLNNAVKFTEEGFIEVGITQTDDHMVRFYVKDTGVGISEDQHGVIFDRFRQGHKSKEKLYGGTGLGLAISKNLAELLGGKIGVVSGNQAGSEFWFTLPAEVVHGKSAPRDFLGVSVDTQWQGKKILVAEDDSSNFSLISEVLKHTNVELIRARDGKEALQLFDEHRGSLDLVLMDIRMPEIDGYQCTRMIKEKEPGLPVIAQTAYAMSGERDQSMEAGCDDYISKPIQVKYLIETIGRHLGKK